MASLKALAKSILTRINCLRTGLPYRRGLYIGKGVKIVRPRNMQIDAEARLMPYSMLVAFGPGRIDVGEDSTVSMFSRISSISYVKIGKHVAMGPSCFIADYNHRYDDVNTPIRHQGYSFKAPEPGQPALELCDGCWIGTNVVVVGNVRIGKNSVVGANSVVTHDIPDYCVAVGMPAKVIKRYNPSTQKWEKV